MAIAADSSNGRNYLVEQFHPDVDYISVMTYDYTGVWADYAWHSSPLYDYVGADNGSLSRSMEYYIARGVPVSKLNIGLAFYGKTFTGCEGPNKSFTGVSEESGSTDYSIIADKIQSGDYIRYWDNIAMVPYCLSSNNEYCSYDDTMSIRLKAEYCISKGFGGAIIWELKSGTLSDGSQPLLNSAAGVLMSSLSVRKMDNAVSNNLNVSQVISSSSSPVVRFFIDKASDVAFKVYDLSGKTVFKANRLYDVGHHQIKLHNANMFHSGIYMLEINSDGKKYQVPFHIIR